MNKKSRLSLPALSPEHALVLAEVSNGSSCSISILSLSCKGETMFYLIAGLSIFALVILLTLIQITERDYQVDEWVKWQR